MSNCPSCAAVVAPAMRFCPGCGAALPPSSATEAPTQRFPQGNAQAAAAETAPLSSGAGDGGRFLAGTVVAGRYRVVGLLGRGGMGEVYRADDLRLEQSVALKFLPERLAAEPGALARLHQEVRSARQVSHPNVCRVHDVDDWQGHVFLTMELIDGEDLASLLRRIGHLPQRKALEVARQLCAGLAAIHAAGMVHRDLKPANVMLDGRGRARITDLGLAGAAADAGSALAGTPAYMAPEQLAGGEVTAKSDLYALGLVLYELFTGKRAFAGEDLGALLRGGRGEGAPPPSSVVPDLDPRVDAVIGACLQGAPGDRPVSALAVAAGLPGGDPLQAALAAGETPSPEMVAAAAAGVALPARRGLLCLGITFVAVLLTMAIAGRGDVVRRVGFDEPPAVLAHRAREVLAAAGYPDRLFDSSYGLHYDERSVWRLRRLAPERLAAVLASGRGGIIHLWYRESPLYLLPSRIGGRGLVTNRDPPWEVASMRGVELDSRGRLLVLRVEPTTATPAVTGAVADWGKLFDLAGLDPHRFVVALPAKVAPMASDERRAWVGTVPELPGVTLRVEAAALGGRPVAFAVEGPWREPSGDDWQYEYVLLLVIAVLAGSWFLRSPRARGSSDRRGALRVAVVVGSCLVLEWALSLRHAPVRREVALLVYVVGTALLCALGGWFWYLVLEPVVRRRAPTRLVSWSRLLAGNLRDPQVGRDVLLGLAAGAVAAAISGAAAVLVAGEPWPGGDLRPLLGTRFLLARLVEAPAVAMMATLGLGVLMSLLRLPLRHEALAAAATFAALATPVLLGGDPLGQRAALLILAALLVVVFWRLGFLATVAYLWVVDLLTTSPLTLDRSSWYLGTSATAAFAVVGLAAWAFHVSRGEQPLDLDIA